MYQFFTKFLSRRTSKLKVSLFIETNLIEVISRILKKWNLKFHFFVVAIYCKVNTEKDWFFLWFFVWGMHISSHKS